MRRPALLKAEAVIAEKLKTQPDDVSWLQASGRTSLLEEDAHAPENAIITLEKAHRLAPNDMSVTIDLASAYLLRGEIANRPEDFGTAVNLLGSALAAKPQDEVAQFNDAIALEKQLLKRQSLEAWQGFLKDHPDSPWVSEARVHLEKLQQEIRERDHGGSTRLKSPQQVLAALQSGNEPEIADIDDHIEEYQDLVVKDWLPQLFTTSPAKPQSLETTEQALSGIATLLESRHDDRWLHDLLAADRRSPQIREAVQLLANSERMIDKSDNDNANQAATRALSLFEQAQFPAGMARAQFSTIFIDQLRDRNPDCAEPARHLAVSAQAHHYAWIAIQAEMEAGFCSSMSDASGLEAVQHSLDKARAHRYRVLEFRAANGVSSLHRTLGDRHKAWNENAASLREYWATDTPRLRGYNLLANLDFIVEEQQQWFLAAAVLRESIPMIADDADVGMWAAAQARLGKALLRCGDLNGAEKSFQVTKLLFQGVPEGTRRDALDAEAELGLAEAQMERGNPRGAINLLDHIATVIPQISEDDLRLQYFEISGIASLRAGAPVKAQSNLDEALKLTEKGLSLVNTSDDRLTWSRRNAPVYRAMVELTLKTDPQRALAYWEWYKGASLRAGPRPASLPAHSRLAAEQSTIAPNVAVVTYAFLANGAAVWVWDSQGIRERWIPVSEPDLDTTARRFVEHCSDPRSDIATLRQEGAEIYRQILLPIEPWLVGHQQLIVEPDGVLRSIPLGALVDAQGRYLNDRYAVTVSPGMEYLDAARKWRGISAASNAFVLGDPIVPGWAPLPDAEQEARNVAASFTHPHLFLHSDPKQINLALEISRADVFHFSGHASSSALSAGLVAGDRGLLDAGALGDLDHRRNQLVVLSACESSPGTDGAFDDQDSLVERLAGAGVPDVVASRWNVDSAGTTELMRELYSQLLTGATVSEAFRSATLEMRSGSSFQHPYYWAGFAVFGRV
jgi:CHAT domain-containing protein